jgi:hypothetical protein
MVTATRDGQRLTAATDEDGRYRFPDITEGVWVVSVEMPGFATEQKPVEVPPAAGGTATLWALSMKPLSEMRLAPAPREAGSRPAAGPLPPRAVAPPVPLTPATNPPIDDDGFVVNGSVNNAAASPFAQPRAFGNNRPQPAAQYAGSAGFGAGSSAWDARPYSFTRDRTTQPAYVDLRLVATFGGPIRLPRLRTTGSRFFVGYQGSRDHTVRTESTVVPTPLERSGDLSRTVDVTGQPVRVRDPVSGGLFEDARIPSNRIAPQASALLAYYPLPNLPEGGRYNYQAPVVSASHQDDLQGRWNHTAGRNLLSGTVALQRSAVDTTSLLGFTDRNRASGLDTSLSWNRRLTRRLALRLRYQLTQMAARTTPHFAGVTNVSGRAGIAGNDQSEEHWGPPGIVLPGVVTLTDVPYQSSRVHADAGGAEAYLNRGRHNVTFGGDVRQSWTTLVSQLDPRGTLTFTGSATGAGFGDFLTGSPAVAALAFGNADKRFRAGTLDAYLNDDFRVTPTLTATIGVRWEYESPTDEAHGRLVNLDVSPGFTSAAAVRGDRPDGTVTGTRYPRTLLRPDRSGLQPRTAIAWRPVPGSSLVVRAGYGIYRNAGVYLPIATLLAQQPPLANAFSRSNDAPIRFTIADAFATPSAALSNTFAVDPDFRVGVTHSWQVAVQRDLPASLLVVGTYMGSRGLRLGQQYLPNSYPAAAANPCPACPSGFIYLSSSG